MPKKDPSSPQRRRIAAASDLPVPIYLNQRIVFDLLATFEDGFAQLTTVRTSAADVDSDKSRAHASLGAGNVFALLGIKFGGEIQRGTDRSLTLETSAEKVHTPTSLFARLRATLREGGYLRILGQSTNDPAVESGEFVEFQAILRKNPLVDTMEGFKELFNLFSAFGDSSSPSSAAKPNRPQSKPSDPNRLVLSQMDAIVKALTASGSMDLVAEILGNAGLRAVVMAEPNYFNDPSLSEIIDGEFRVLGKVTKVVRGNSDESINLLRKTSFGRFQQQMIGQLTTTFSTAAQSGLKFPEIETEITGPAFQLIPIGIFS